MFDCIGGLIAVYGDNVELYLMMDIVDFDIGHSGSNEAMYLALVDGIERIFIIVASGLDFYKDYVSVFVCNDVEFVVA